MNLLSVKKEYTKFGSENVIVTVSGVDNNRFLCLFEVKNNM